MKSLKKNAVLNFIRSFMSLIFPLITFPYVSRILAPDGIGKVEYSNSIASYFTLLAGLGIGTYGVREVAKRRDNQYSLDKFSSEIFTLLTLTTAVSCFLYFCLIFAVPHLHDYNVFLMLASLNIVFSTLGIGWFYAGLEEYSYITTRTIIFQIVSIILLFTLVKTKEDALMYLFIGVISSTGSNILNLIHARKFTKLRFVNPNLKAHIPSLMLLFGISVISSVYNTLDTTMIGSLSTNTEVGFYNAATKINKIVLNLITSISYVVFPRLSYYAEHDRKEFKNLINKSVIFILCISIPSVVGLNLLSLPIMSILCGEKFLAAIPTMKIMNPIILIIAISNFIGAQIFIPLKKEKITIRAVTTAACVNFILNFILIRKYQSFGAALSTIIAETIVLTHQIIFGKEWFNIRKILINTVEFIISALVMAVFVILIKNSFINIKFQLVLGIVCGAVIYYAVLLLFRNELILTITKQFINKILRK